MRRALALGLALLGAAGAAAGEPEPPPVAARPALHGDAVPAGPGVGERLAEIARRVERAARYPASARERGASGEALVSFLVGGDGTPRDLELVRTSGSGALDRAALRAVAEAAPLPFVHGRIQVPVRFALDTVE
jgi:protein TonB